MRYIQRKHGWKRPGSMSPPQMKSVQRKNASAESYSSLQFQPAMIQAGRRTPPKDKILYSRESNYNAGFPLAMCASKKIRASESELPYVRKTIEVEGYEGTLVMEVSPTLESFYWYLSTHPKTVLYWRWNITSIINLRTDYQPFTKRTKGDQLHQFCRQVISDFPGISLKQLM